ncbi:MAG: MBL fold metallo-hydrolase [Pseudonocardia sp.]|nr:MBL fold metallo-hydrolase [Pseudonocardia sp.]
MHWQARPFPDANLLLLPGPTPAVVDTGFVGHAEQTRDWAHARSGGRIEVVVNTHWHSDHVGGNAALQATGAAIAASAPDAAAVRRRDPGCCLAEYLDQPVAPYTVDIALDDGEVLRLGETEWQVVRTPGHTPGHLCLWQPDERLLVVGDALSDYDVGWVATALDGPDATATALASVERIAALHPRVLLPAHGPVPGDPEAALAQAHRRARRLVDDPDGAVWYGARRILAYALIIRDGIPLHALESYLLQRAWLTDAADLLRRPAAEIATELVDTMRRSGAVVERDGRLCTATDYAPVDPATLDHPWPNAWPRKLSNTGEVHHRPPQGAGR